MPMRRCEADGFPSGKSGMLRKTELAGFSAWQSYSVCLYGKRLVVVRRMNCNTWDFVCLYLYLHTLPVVGWG